MDTQEERRIIERALAQLGSTPSPSLSPELDQLFLRHEPMLRSLCRRMVRDPQRADELVQEAQLIAYTRLGELREGTRLSTWVFGIARKLCLNETRKAKETLDDDGIFEAEDPAARPLSQLLREEREALIREAAAAVLEPLEQEAIHLLLVEGLSYEQIDQLLGLEGSGARGLLQRCRRKLSREVLARLEKMGHGRSFLDSRG